MIKKASLSQAITVTPTPPIPFTEEAFAKIIQQIEALLVEEKALIGRVNTAREQGDLSENGAYKYGKMELGRVRRELRRLQLPRKNGQVVQPTKGSVVGFGSTVLIKNESSSFQYQLVSEHESNPALGKLSMQSPIGASLLGKKAGETVTFNSPKGPQQFTITAVE